MMQAIIGSGFETCHNKNMKVFFCKIKSQKQHISKLPNNLPEGVEYKRHCQNPPKEKEDKDKYKDIHKDKTNALSFTMHCNDLEIS